MIKPTVGRVVWYYNGTQEQRQPLAAIVVFVHTDRMVNLSVFNAAGAQYGESSVRLVQEDEGRPAKGRWCEWMPY